MGGIADEFTSEMRVRIRQHLRLVCTQIRSTKRYHAERWSQQPGGHPEPCSVCTLYDQNLAGVEIAIRHFRAKPGRK